jgi:Protein of unknown function (DUF2997)
LKTIDVIVSRDGSSRVQTHGFNGDKCREASKFVEEALGLKQNEQLTADFYRSEVNTQQQARQQP